MRILLLYTIVLISGYSYSQFGDERSLLNTTLHVLDIVSFDFDNDGDMDIVSSSKNDQKIAFYENLGENQFRPQKVISSSIVEARSIFAADLNGDGNGDILVSSFLDNKISWFENLGNLEFGEEVVINDTINRVSDLYVEDLDNDGDNDIITASYIDDKVVWLENGGDGTFITENLISSVTDGATSVFSKDLDGDGDFDILSSSFDDDKIAWYENLGDGIFDSERVISTTINGAQFVSSIDFDNDGDNDIVAISAVDGEVSLHKNTGLGVFTLDQVFTSSAYNCDNVTFSDLDNDGDLDMVIPVDNTFYIPNTVIYKNDDGNFDTSYSIPNSSRSKSLLVDVDGDGLDDLMSMHLSINKISWIKNLGSFDFGSEMVLTSEGSLNLKGHVVDMNLDGKSDLVFYQNSHIKWYENIGDGVFGATQRTIADPPNHFNMRNCIPADVDGDGDVDFIGGLYSAAPVGFGWFENLGEQEFSEYQSISTDIEVCTELVFEDIDNDGVKDVLVGTFNTDREIAWFKNLGGGDFGPKNIITTGEIVGLRAIFLEDLNNDGKMDLVTASSHDDKITWFKNDGGSFGPLQLISDNADNASDVFVADFDNDGYKDIVSSSFADKKIAWYRNLADGTFSSEIIIDILESGANFVTGDDINGDGSTDIIATSSSVKWYENNGDGTFSDGTELNTDMYGGAHLRDLVISDFNGDDDVDIVVFCSIPGSISKIILHSNFQISEIQVSGQVYVDLNENGTFDSTDYYAHQIGVKADPKSAYAYTYTDGNYFMNFVDTLGTYLISAEIPEYWKLSTDSLAYSVTIDTSHINRDSLDFGLVPDTIINVLASDLTGGFPRCNTLVNYWVSIGNDGTTIPSGIIRLDLDDSLNFVSSAIMPDSIVGQSIFWSYDSLSYFSTESINLVVEMPDFHSIDDTIFSYLEVGVDSILSEDYLSVDTLWQVIRCAYDPNIKTAIPTGMTDEGYISPETSTLEYMIQFQNTGNDTAITVVITDQLQDYIDINSFRPISSSHYYEVQISSSGLIEFTFENIMLPDSNINEIASHGFVKYEIDLLPDLPQGALIKNSANIYFDSNPAIVTNTKTHHVFDCDFYPSNLITYETPQLTALTESHSYQWIDCTNDSIYIIGAVEQSYTPVANGSYAVISSNGFCYSTSDCFEISASEVVTNEESFINIYPNPADQNVFIETTDKVQSVQITAINGKVFLTRENILTNETVSISIQDLPKGMYIVNVLTSSQSVNKFIIIQ